MENIENNESQHPVLLQLKNRITELETQLETKSATATALDEERLNTIRDLRSKKWEYESKVERVLTEAYEDYDKDTIKHIASELDIALTVKKQYEVNATFTIDVEVDIDEADSIDPEWDFDLSVNHHSIVDYTSDVVWSKEIS